MIHTQMYTANLLAILAILLVAVVVAFIYIKKTPNVDAGVSFVNKYTIKYMVDEVALGFADDLKENLKEENLTRQQLEAKEAQKQELRTSLKEAAYGNPAAKQYIKARIKDMLIPVIPEDKLNAVIPFNDPERLTCRDKFEIMMHYYTKSFGSFNFDQMVKDNGWLDPKYDAEGNVYYQVDDTELEAAYYKFLDERAPFMTPADKRDIIAQRVFSEYKGAGAVDLLFNSSIDELDCGVSGIPQDRFDIKVEDVAELTFSHESVWVVLHGINLRLKFLSLGSQEELVRICSNVYKFNAPYCLSRRRPKVVSTMKDGSRVVVVRPPVSDSWACFIRKFDSMPSLAPEQVLTDPGNNILFTFVKWLIRGYTNIGITGMQGTGKTTFLKSVIRYIPRDLNIRVQELEFETNLRYTYPDRNIVTLQETDSVSAQEGLDLQKKMNGSCNILGEVATAEAASWLIQTSKVASLFAMFTHHAKTTKDLVIAIRNNLLDSKGGAGFTNEKAAEDMVARAINIDIHMEKVRGHRFCSRITEIIPINDRRYPSEHEENKDKALSDKALLDSMESYKRVTDRQLFETKDLVVWEDGKYVFKSMPSEALMERIFTALPKDEIEKCKKEFVIAAATKVEATIVTEGGEAV